MRPNIIILGAVDFRDCHSKEVLSVSFEAQCIYCVTDFEWS